MLRFNIKKKLKNGYQGTSIGVVPGTGNSDQQILVKFPKVGIVKIGHTTRCKYCTPGNVLAT